MLALGRALGETMAVTSSSATPSALPVRYFTGHNDLGGNRQRIAESDGLHQSGLILLGLLLFVLSSSFSPRRG